MGRFLAGLLPVFPAVAIKEPEKIVVAGQRSRNKPVQEGPSENLLALCAVPRGIRELRCVLLSSVEYFLECRSAKNDLSIFSMA